MSPLIEAKSITKRFPRRGQSDLEILKGLDLTVSSGQALCILGASGAGKSTLLNILGTLDRPSSGELSFQGANLIQASDQELAEIRNRKMGFVFQFHHLLSEFTALENVIMPARISTHSNFNSRNRALDLLHFFGLKDRVHHYPSELSGGERQRVAIARALMMEPEILYADEPTGNLDSKNSEIIEDYFFQLIRETGIALVVVTHSEAFARKFETRRSMVDGLWAD